MTVTGILPAICTTTNPIGPHTPRLPEPRTTPGTSNAKSLINIYLNTSRTTGNRPRPDPARKSRPPRRARLVGHPRRSNEGNIFVVVPKLFTAPFYPRKAPVFRFRGTPLPTPPTPRLPHSSQPFPVKHSMPGIHRTVLATPRPRPHAAVKQLAWPRTLHPCHPRNQSSGGRVQRRPRSGMGRGGDVLIALRKALERRRGRRHPGWNRGLVQLRPKFPTRVSPLAGAGSF